MSNPTNPNEEHESWSFNFWNQGYSLLTSWSEIYRWPNIKYVHFILGNMYVYVSIFYMVDGAKIHSNSSKSKVFGRAQ